MTVSTTLQWKILKTKKRLSKGEWYLPSIVLISTGLFVILSFMLRSVSLSAKYGIVRSEIPVLPVTLEHPSSDTTFLPKSQAKISQDTTVIILDVERFIFGDLKAFSSELSSSNNKFAVSHDHGSPDMPALVKNITKWLQTNQSNTPLKNKNQVAILIPTAEVPGYVVIQVLSSLQRSKIFKKVILGGGVI